MCTFFITGYQLGRFSRHDHFLISASKRGIKMNFYSLSAWITRIAGAKIQQHIKCNFAFISLSIQCWKINTPESVSIPNVHVDICEMMCYVCFCVMCPELNLYNELKFQHLEKTSNVALNKRFTWGHNKSNSDLYILTNRKTNAGSILRVSKDRWIAVGARTLHDRKLKWRNN
jgi:hypothetical protein